MDIRKDMQNFSAHIMREYGESVLFNHHKPVDLRHAELFKAWQAAQAVPKWISVKGALPPENTLVLALSRTFGNVFNLYDVMALDEFNESQTTHWMLLPEPPKEPAND